MNKSKRMKVLGLKTENVFVGESYKGKEMERKVFPYAVGEGSVSTGVSVCPRRLAGSLVLSCLGRWGGSESGTHSHSHCAAFTLNHFGWTRS